MNGFVLRTFAAMLFVFGTLTRPTVADTFIYDLDKVVEPPPPGNGATTPPWLTAVIHDNNDGTVSLKMIASNLQPGEKVDSWVFNLNPNLDPKLLSFALDSAETTIKDPPTTANKGITTGVNNQNVPGAMGFDIKFDFKTNTADAFTNGLFVTYDISYYGNDPNDLFSATAFFSYLNQPRMKPGEYNSAAHVNGIGNNDDSGTIASVPEPSYVTFGMLLLSGLFWIERKRIRSFFQKQKQVAAA